MTVPIHVDAGFGWTPILLLVLNGLGLSGFLIAWVKIRPHMKEIAERRESNLLDERTKDMASMRERIAALEAQQIKKDRLNEAQRALSRHRINNLTTSFNALLLLLKKGVAVEIAVEEIEKMRTDQMELEANEAAMIRTAAIKAGLDVSE